MREVALELPDGTDCVSVTTIGQRQEGMRMVTEVKAYVFGVREASRCECDCKKR